MHSIHSAEPASRVDLVGNWEGFREYVQGRTRTAIGTDLMQGSNGTLAIMTKNGYRTCQLVPEQSTAHSPESALSAGRTLEQLTHQWSYLSPKDMRGAAALRKGDYIIAIGGDFPPFQAMALLLTCLLQYGVIGGRLVHQVLDEHQSDGDDVADMFNLLEAPLHALAPQVGKSART